VPAGTESENARVHLVRVVGGQRVSPRGATDPELEAVGGIGRTAEEAREVAVEERGTR
jgi:hypothetical protein